MKRVELGVFLPIAKNGFIRSTNAPAYVPSYRDNLEICQIAEEIGLDYAFSMLKWRGRGGATQYWDSSFDSFSLMAALAAATKRLRLIATVNPLLHHPTSMAKMAATIQDVSNGRLGLNIITGASLDEYSQMGVLPPDYDGERYNYAAEWVQVLKRLWAEPEVTHHGRYFHLEACVCDPKPEPRPFLVCAGSSEEGLNFTARETDYLFGGRASGQRVREIAKGLNKPIKTAGTVTVVLKDTKAAADAYWAFLEAGADTEATANIAAVHAGSTRATGQRAAANAVANKKSIRGGTNVQGGPAEVADGLIELAHSGDLDSLVMIFPDYVDGLRRLGRDVMPILREALDLAPATGPTR
jgi:pyrimidine oxygenase